MATAASTATAVSSFPVNVAVAQFPIKVTAGLTLMQARHCLHILQTEFFSASLRVLTCCVLVHQLIKPCYEGLQKDAQRLQKEYREIAAKIQKFLKGVVKEVDATHVCLKPFLLDKVKVVENSEISHKILNFLRETYNRDLALTESIKSAIEYLIDPQKQVSGFKIHSNVVSLLGFRQILFNTDPVAKTLFLFAANSETARVKHNYFTRIYCQNVGMLLCFLQTVAKLDEKVLLPKSAFKPYSKEEHELQDAIHNGRSLLQSLQEQQEALLKLEISNKNYKVLLLRDKMLFRGLEASMTALKK